MKEYITKNRARQFVCGHCNEVYSEEPCEPSDCDWMAFIDKEPAADVVEVRHGKWIHSEIEDDDWGRIFHKWTCSVCGYSVAHNPTGENYCPHCGAKMDVEEV